MGQIKNIKLHIVTDIKGGSSEVGAMNKSALEQELKKHGQEHLLRFWDDLNDPATKKDEFIEPLPSDIVGKITDSPKEQVDSWYNEGLKLIAEGTVAVLLLAGGQ